MQRLIKFTLCFCFFYQSANAQMKQHYWSFRGGYLRAYPTISEPAIALPNVYNALGVAPINSYYLGVAYTKLWSKTGYTIEGNLQRKGMTGVDLNQFSKSSPINSYYYLNISPLAYYNVFKNISVQLGPEINILLAKNSVFSNSRAVEVGAAIRINYTIDRLTLQAGSSHGFTPYSISRFNSQQDIFSLRSTTLQIGLSYRLKYIDL